MNNDKNDRVGTEAALARIFGGTVALLGAAVLTAWIVGIDSLKSIAPGLASMKFNAALAFVAAGLSLSLAPGPEPGGRMRAAIWLAAAAGLIGLLTLLQYATGGDLGIDQLLMRDRMTKPEDVPGRMSAISASCFVLFGATRLAACGAGRWARAAFSALCLSGLLVSLLAILGYAYGVPVLYRPLPATSIAIHTAIAFMVLFAGLLLSRPDRGWVRLLRSRGAGGLLARRVLPAVVLIPPVIGWVRLQGQNAGQYGTEFGLALFAITNIAILTALLWWAALRIDRLDAERQASLASLEETGARLRESEQRYRNVSDLIEIGIWIEVDGAIIYSNAHMDRIIGADVAGSTIGMPMLSFFRGDDLELAAERRRTAMRELQPLPLREGRVYRLDGRVVVADMQLIPFVQAGKLHLMSIIRDVTAEREAAMQLRQAQKMEVIGQLTGGMAHDFNNLLTIVIGRLDEAIDQTKGELQLSLGSALRAAERGAELTHRLLAFARQQPLRAESLDLNEVVTSMEDLLRRTLGQDIEIAIRKAPGLWNARSDRGQIENALLNLALNARDAMEQGGKLTIETSNATLDSDYAARNPDVAPGDYAMLTVSDTGAGMPPEVIARAFEPFFTTKNTGRGTGLGLSMIYGFARQSHGHLKVYSEVGLGTSIRLYLPRSTAARSVPATPAPAAPDACAHGMEAVLVVEDDADVRTLAMKQLRSLGYQVVEAADGRQARTIIDTAVPIDLLFTDAVLPGGVTGMQLADAARQARPNLKVLLTSGYAYDVISRQGPIPGSLQFLTKPYRKQDLAAAVRAALDGLPAPTGRDAAPADSREAVKQ